MKVLKLELLDYWRAETGSGRGTWLDGTVQRTPAGLPMIPGRTVKGLLRDAVRQLRELGLFTDLPDERQLFGSDPGELQKLGPRGRYESVPGAIRVDDARLSLAVEARLIGLTDDAQRARLAAGLFRHVASTAMDDARGVAKDHSLRRVEVAVPLTLRARLKPLSELEGWEACIERALPLLRALGKQRSRGFGRVAASLEEVTHG